MNKQKGRKQKVDEEAIYLNKDGDQISDIEDEISEDNKKGGKNNKTKKRLGANNFKNLTVDDMNDSYEDEDEKKETNNNEQDEDYDNLDNPNLNANKKKDKVIDTAHLNVDMAEVNLRIQSIVNILSDFATKKEGNKSRSEYMAEFKGLLIVYYDYNDYMMNLVLNLFAPNEAVEFLESNNSQRVQSIRTNTIKSKRRELAKSLIQRGVNLDPLAEWTKVGLKIYDSQVPIGATPEYLSGQYMLQSGSSFLPVLALNPLENEKVLDMAAAPGGKTTYIAQLMKNTGVLVANDLKKERLKSLYFNIHRLGVKSAIIVNYDGREIPSVFNSFDRVLLDAPCSGLGVISKDQSIKTYKDILENTRIQKELILAAIDACSHKSKTGGVIVYSTCSISVEENEWVVDYAIRNRYVKLIETDLVIGEPGFTSFRDKRFHPSMKLTKRIYPHLHNMDGFFVAKFKKYAEGSKLKAENENNNSNGNGNGNGKKKKQVDEYDPEYFNEEGIGAEEFEDEVNEEVPELVEEHEDDKDTNGNDKAEKKEEEQTKPKKNKQFLNKKRKNNK